MSGTSIYPDFFRAGLDRLRDRVDQLESLQGLFSALEQFRRDLTGRQDSKAILELTEAYVQGLDLFGTVGFFLVHPESFDFDLKLCTPSDQSGALDRLVRQEMKAGRFIWALRQNAPTLFSSPAPAGAIRGLFHTLGVANRRVGMFCGLLASELVPHQELAFSLLSLLLGACSDALAGVRTAAELQNQVRTANLSLDRALRENEILARIPAESPEPVLRFNQSGLVLYSNQAGQELLRTLGCRIGDLVSGEWMHRLAQVFASGHKQEFEAQFGCKTFTFLIVPVPDAGYANFYGTEITARKQAEMERERLIQELQEALAKVKTLSGLVPICAWCKKVRDDTGFWKEVEEYVQCHSEATFSHAICPQCRQEWLAKGALPAGGGR